VKKKRGGQFRYEVEALPDRSDGVWVRLGRSRTLEGARRIENNELDGQTRIVPIRSPQQEKE
jgi:hypothetical protein